MVVSGGRDGRKKRGKPRTWSCAKDGPLPRKKAIVGEGRPGAESGEPSVVEGRRVAGQEGQSGGASWSWCAEPVLGSAELVLESFDEVETERCGDASG